MQKINAFIKYLNDLKIEGLYFDKTFKELTSLKIGGQIRCFFEPLTLDDLIIAYKFLLKENIDFFTIGNGTNVLAKDEEFCKVVISLKHLNKVTELKEGIFLAMCGVKASTLAFNMAKMGYTGLEFLSVIPGSLGGVIYMNAGAYGSEMKDVLKEVIFLDERGSLTTFTKDELDFRYRYSIFQELKGIIVSCIIEVKKTANSRLPLEKIKTYRENKKLTQPIGILSAGSTFKNGSYFKAWEVIDKLGYRGYSENGITVSSKHPNFIYNNKDAKFIDMINLLEKIKTNAKTSLNIDLECEWIILE